MSNSNSKTLPVEKECNGKSYFKLKSQDPLTSVVCWFPFYGEFCKRYCWIFWSSKYFAGLTLIPKLLLGNILHEITVEIEIEFPPILFIPCPSDGASCCGRHLIGLRKKRTEPVITNRAEKNIWCPRPYIWDWSYSMKSNKYVLLHYILKGTFFLPFLDQHLFTRTSIIFSSSDWAFLCWTQSIEYNFSSKQCFF